LALLSSDSAEKDVLHGRLKMLQKLKRKLSASNALRHGVHAKGLLCWEDAQEVAAHIKATIDAHNPCHPILKEMAQQMAWASWLQVRNQRSTALFELCDPLGRLLAKHKGEDAIRAGIKLFDQRDNELSAIADAGRVLCKIAETTNNAKLAKQLAKTGKQILVDAHRIANHFEMTSEYFFGIGEECQKQSDRAIQLQAHLQKHRALYFHAEQCLATRNELLPQIEVKSSDKAAVEAETEDKFDLTKSNDAPKSVIVQKVLRDRRDSDDDGSRD
jgi:hypothetical protein